MDHIYIYVSIYIYIYFTILININIGTAEQQNHKPLLNIKTNMPVKMIGFFSTVGMTQSV